MESKPCRACSCGLRGPGQEAGGGAFPAEGPISAEALGRVGSACAETRKATGAGAEGAEELGVFAHFSLLPFPFSTEIFTAEHHFHHQKQNWCGQASEG